MAGIIGGDSSTTGPDVIGAGDSAGVFDVIISGGTSSSTFDDDGTGGGGSPSLPGTGGGEGDGEAIPIDQTPLDHGDRRRLWFESLDGTVRIDTNIDAETILRNGATGLDLPPREVIRETVPGITGSVIREDNDLEREVFLPMEIAHDTDQAAFLASMLALRTLVRARNVELGPTMTGAFRLVVSSPTGGERLLTVTYLSGLEGIWGGAESGALHQRFGLVLLAVDPYFRARAPRRILYSTTGGKVFLGTGDNSNPWPRQISTGLVVGNDMTVTVGGNVEVWPTVTVVGQVSTAEITWPGTDVVVPAGVPSASSLVLVMDPRLRSARLNGIIAWSRITLTGLIAPLQPGDNPVSVNVATTGDGAGLILEWLEGWDVAWA